MECSTAIGSIDLKDSRKLDFFTAVTTRPEPGSLQRFANSFMHLRHRPRPDQLLQSAISAHFLETTLLAIHRRFHAKHKRLHLSSSRAGLAKRFAIVRAAAVFLQGLGARRERLHSHRSRAFPPRPRCRSCISWPRRRFSASRRFSARDCSTLTSQSAHHTGMSFPSTLDMTFPFSR